MKGRTIDCPDCGQPVLLRESGEGLLGEAVERTIASESPPLPPLQLPLLPRVLAIGTAIVLLGTVVYFSLPEENDVHTPPSTSPPDETTSLTAQNDTASGAPAPPPNQVPEENLLSPVEHKLTGIYGLIQKHLTNQETFPRGTVGNNPTPDAQFSWIAALNRQTSPHQGSVNWEQPWNAPVHDDFVRRRYVEFENPEVAQVAGDDRYPATHFVGVTGVGNDSARLPKQHPRSGIFGDNRETKVADVKDGLTNTMLIAGVNQQLGSWARSGRSTLRGFEQEPYINGPDGFGTGQPDGMYVLMADGSVRFLAKQTDPVIIRRLAAMADGLPIDSQVPGDPLAMSMERQPAAEPNDGPAEDDVPITVPLAPDIPPFDIAGSLQQKVVSYRQSRPTALHIVLFELQELIGAPIDLSQIPETMQQQEVAVDLQDVTLGQILKELTKQVGAKFDITAGRILIQSDQK